ncbi:MAG: hypothetical protein K2X35_16165 [Bryobacteraceae bacterium]|nr:hypothetical protein [Bryobacteraceae bacterium]
MGWLRVAGMLSFALAALHLAMVFVGAPAYRFFDAGEQMASAAEEGSPFPALITLLLVLVFTLFGIFGLSGAGVLRELPFLKGILTIISVIFIVRGLAVLQQGWSWWLGSGVVGPKQLVFSLASLGIGTIFAIGTWKLWFRPRPPVTVLK